MCDTGDLQHGVLDAEASSIQGGGTGWALAQLNHSLGG